MLPLVTGEVRGCAGTPVEYRSNAVDVTIEPSAALRVVATAAVSQVMAGKAVEARVSVTNVRAADYLSLVDAAIDVEAPAEVGAKVQRLLEPELPSMLGPSDSLTMVFTLEARKPARISAIVSVAALDLRTGRKMRIVADPLVLTFLDPSRLKSTFALPTSVECGSPFLVTMVVENCGGSDADRVAPSPLVMAARSTGRAFRLNGPIPAVSRIAVGAKAVFTWTYSATVEGELRLFGGVSGTDTYTSHRVVAPTLSTHVLRVRGSERCGWM
jgi:hypothetical protein